MPNHLPSLKFSVIKPLVLKGTLVCMEWNDGKLSSVRNFDTP